MKMMIIIETSDEIVINDVEYIAIEFDDNKLQRLHCTCPNHR